MREEWMRPETLQAVQQLVALARSLDLSMAQLALAWVLREPAVSSAIIGASRPEQIDDNVGASGVKLSDEALQKIDQIIRPHLPTT